MHSFENSRIMPLRIKSSKSFRDNRDYQIPSKGESFLSENRAHIGSYHQEELTASCSGQNLAWELAQTFFLLITWVNKLCLCVRVYGCAHKYRCPWKTGESPGSPGARVTGDCELPEKVVGNLAWFSGRALSAEPSLQLVTKNNWIRGEVFSTLDHGQIHL